MAYVIKLKLLEELAYSIKSFRI